MTARFAAHNPPDVFYVDSSVRREWAQQGVLAAARTPTSRRASTTRAAFFPSLLNAFKVREDDLRLPEGLVAARDGDQHLDAEPAAGVRCRRPGRSSDRPPRRWHRRTRVPNGGKPICLPRRLGSHAAVHLPEQGRRSRTFSRRRLASAVELLRRPDQQAVSQRRRTSSAPGWCGEALGKQKAAIIFEGNWALPFMKRRYPRSATASFPMVKGKTGGNLGSPSSYSMAKDSKNKQAAWTLLSWLTGPVGHEAVDLEGPRPAVAHGREGDRRARSAFLAAAPYAHGWGFPNFTNTYTVMNNDLHGGDQRQQDDRADAGRCRQVAEEVGSTSGPLPCGLVRAGGRPARCAMANRSRDVPRPEPRLAVRRRAFVRRAGATPSCSSRWRSSGSSSCIRSATRSTSASSTGGSSARSRASGSHNYRDALPRPDLPHGGQEHRAVHGRRRAARDGARPLDGARSSTRRSAAGRSSASAFYFPSIASSAAITTIAIFLLNADGLLNHDHRRPPLWFADPSDGALVDRRPECLDDVGDDDALLPRSAAVDPHRRLRGGGARRDEHLADVLEDHVPAA